ncbi:hypothetical protein [Thioclava sp. GXIMD2076]|uniref:hypothetical protein n=1 Tax=Thioclava sp. GXIMD2076 TaxID=3131931 RepID=UPI0030D5053A
MNETVIPDRSFRAVTDEARQSGGFCHELAHHALAYLPQGGAAGRHLVVSFGNLTTSQTGGEQHPWGQHLLQGQGWSVLGVINNRNDWYRDAELIAALETLRDEGFFKRFDRVSFYGASMGGFGALTFSRLAPGAHVVAFAPQSTLDPSRVPFEDRYAAAALKGDWSLPYGDAAYSTRDLASAEIFYDPFIAQDKAHAERLTAPQVRFHQLRHFGHKLPFVLLKLRLLKEVSLHALTGDLSDRWLARALRVRHQYVYYTTLMLTNAHARGHDALAMRGTDLALRQTDHWKLRKLRKSLRTTTGDSEARVATRP